jgi:hypothetical protein
MVVDPAGRVEMLKLAVPFDKVDVPRIVVPFIRLTVPEAAAGVTATVNAMLVPSNARVPQPVKVVVVAIFCTVSATALDVLELSLASPL